LPLKSSTSVVFCGGVAWHPTKESSAMDNVAADKIREAIFIGEGLRHD
jgi:hypothetical protein